MPSLSEAAVQGVKIFGLGRETHQQPLIYGGSDQGVCHETSSHSSAKLGKHQDAAVESADGMFIEYGKDSLAKRRRRILSRNDWVGANIQRPLKLRFTVAGNDERLGKRRRITPRHQNQFGAVAQPMITSPFAKSRTKQRPHGSLIAQGATGHTTGALLKNHVRISIGGRHVAAGVGSSTSHSKIVGGRFSSSQTSISDEMLLDGDDMNREQRHLPWETRQCLSNPASPPLAPSIVVGNGSALSVSPRDLPVRTSHRKKVLSSHGRSNGTINRHAAAGFVDLEEIIATSWTGQQDSPLDVSQQLGEHGDDLCDPSDQQIELLAKSHSNLVTLRSKVVRNLPDITSYKYADVTQIPEGTNPESFSPNARYVTDVSRQLPEIARRSQPVSRGKLRRNRQLNSHPELLHPIPLTSRISRVLCGTSSEAGSNVAQLNIEPTTTRSQMLDEEIWKTWVLSSPSDLSNESDNGAYDEVSISPGISNCEHRYVRRNSRDKIERHTKDMAIALGASGHDYASNQEVEQQGVESPMDMEREKNHTEVLPNLAEHSYYETSPPTKPVVDYKSLFLSRPRKLPSPPKPKPGRIDNPDDAWMKFILSDDENDDEGDILQPLALQPAFTPAPIQRLPTSSMGVHLSTKTTSSSQSEHPISSVTGLTTTPNHVKSNTITFSIDGPHTSNHTTQGSNPSSSDDFSQQPSSVDQIRTYPTSSCPTPSRPIRRLTFTKPPRFPSPSRGTSPETTAATAGSPVHIGKGFSIARLRDRGGAAKRHVDSRVARTKRHRGRNVYSPETEDDVESIEDD